MIFSIALDPISLFSEYSSLISLTGSFLVKYEQLRG